MATRSAATKLPRLVPVLDERDIVVARSVGMEICRGLGFSITNQTKVATAISELARNIVLYAGSGQISIQTISGRTTGIEVVVEDQGPGIEELEAIMAGRYRSPRGMGLGLRGTKRLMDYFEIRSGTGRGTKITIRMYLR